MSYRRPEYPCTVPHCAAVSHVKGRPCAVHRKWHPGPGPAPCTLCRQPITTEELWAYQNQQLAHPVHAACVNHKWRPRKPKPQQQTLF